MRWMPHQLDRARTPAVQPLPCGRPAVQTMRAAQEEKQKFEVVAEKRRRALSLVVLFLFASCALLIFVVGRRAAAVTNIRNASDIKLETQPVSKESNPSTPAQDYSKFSHFSPGEHAALASRYSCNICHQRRDNSAEPRLPGHRECINCHQTQFNTPGTPFCLICHTSE